MNTGMGIFKNGQSISAEELVVQLEEFEEFRELTTYHIKETNKTGTHKYDLTNLSGMIEDGFLIFDDIKGILEEHNNYILNLISLNYINQILERWKEGSKKYTVLILLQDGSIQIDGEIG
jgi:hypothetical protein